MVRLYDLSVSLRPANMESRDVVVRVTSHAEAARRFAKCHGVRVSALPAGRFFPTERILLGSHAATHLDAPYHFYPTSEGRPAKFIDEVPLEWVFAEAHVLDFRYKGPSEHITEYDVADQLASLDRSPVPGDIVLNWTGGTDGYDHDPRFGQSAAGMDSGALAQLFERGITIVGVDSATMDMPIKLMVERFLSGDVAAYFPIHRAGRLKEWTHAEKLGHLSSLPARTGFKVVLFPIKLAKGTGAWTRAAAIEDPWLDSYDVDLVDLSLPIMNSSFEPVASLIVTRHHEEARRAKAKELKIDTSEVIHASAMDTVDTYTQAGTHVCAPWYFAPERGGRPSMTVDQVPLEWMFGDAVLLDFAGRTSPDRPISLADVQSKLESIGTEARPGTIVLLSTGAAAHFYDDPAYASSAPALSVEAFRWLLDQGVRVVGSDAESLDGPVRPMVEALRAGRSDVFFPIHYTGGEREFCLINKLDLRPLSGLGVTHGFKVCAFPVKLEGCGAAWARVVAFVERATTDCCTDHGG